MVNIIMRFDTIKNGQQVNIKKLAFTYEHSDILGLGHGDFITFDLVDIRAYLNMEISYLTQVLGGSRNIVCKPYVADTQTIELLANAFKEQYGAGPLEHVGITFSTE